MSSRRRDLVLTAVAGDAFRTAQDVHAGLRSESERIGLSTVYRTLQTLAAEGDVDVLRTDTGEAAYRRCSNRHHHHLRCRACGRTVEIAAAAVERWTARVAHDHGFSDMEHTVEVTGVCGLCAGRH